MGLLTDPTTGSGKIIKFLLKRERPLCFFLYISGIVWILLLALPIFNDSKYEIVLSKSTKLGYVIKII